MRTITCKSVVALVFLSFLMLKVKFFAKMFGGFKNCSTFAVPIRKELKRDPRMTSD
jgi:hypothetical protein